MGVTSLRRSATRVYRDSWSRHTLNGATNGIFAKINTGNGADIPTIVSELIKIKELLANKKFRGDFDDIALNSPEIHETTIQAFFIHIGYSPKQKTIGKSFQRVLDLDDVMYHAIADGGPRVKGGRFFNVLTIVEASYTSDQKTRNKTEEGERPMGKECFTIIKMLAEDTTMKKYNHTLGLITAVVDSFCMLCKAGGGGMCIHCSQALYIQFFHWTEGRPRLVSLAATRIIKPTIQNKTSIRVAVPEAANINCGGRASNGG
eukprot:scaffold86628_cov53-Attheya_sp.AAC.1